MMMMIMMYLTVPVLFGPTGYSTTRSADPENPNPKLNMKWIG